MLQRVLEIFHKSNVERVIVVLGANAVEVKKRVKFAHEMVVVNPRFAEGMSSSLRLGLEKVTREAGAVIIALGDQPFVLPTTIDMLVSAYSKSGAHIVVPTYHGTRGNPVLFDRSVFSQLARIRGDVGAKSVVQKNSAEVLEVEVSDKGVLVDIDTLVDLEGGTEVMRKRSRARAAHLHGRPSPAS